MPRDDSRSYAAMRERLRKKAGIDASSESKQEIPVTGAKENLQVLWDQANTAANSRDESKRNFAKQIFKQLSDKPPLNVLSLYQLANLYKEDEENGRQTESARTYYEKVYNMLKKAPKREIEKNIYAEVCIRLSYYLANGISGPKDLVLASRLCQEVVETGNQNIRKNAAERLAMYYMEGIGIAEAMLLSNRQKEALKCFEIAQSTDPYYQKVYGDLLNDLQKYKLAVKQWENASVNGDIGAILNLAITFHFGKEDAIAIDYEKAKRYYQKIIDTPDVDAAIVYQAQHNLRHLYTKELVKPQDEKETIEADSLLKKLAQASSDQPQVAYAQFLLGLKLIIVKKKIEIGLKKIIDVAAQDHLPAMITLGKFYYGGHNDIKKEANPKAAYEISTLR